MNLTKELCRLLFETSPGAILVMRDHKIVACNASAASLLAQPAEILRGSSLVDLSPAGGALAAKIEAAQQGAPQNFAWRFKRSTGETFEAQIWLNAVEYDNQTYLQAAIFETSPSHPTAALETALKESSALQPAARSMPFFDRANVARGYIFNQTDTQPLALAGDAEHGGQKAAAENGQTFAKPMIIGGEVIGQIGIYDGQPLNPEDQEFLNLVAEQVAEALERTQLLEQTQQRAVELEAVAQVSMAASAALDVNELLQQVVDLTKDSFNLYHAHIYLLDETSQMLNLTAGSGQVGEKMVAQGWSIPLNREHSLVARVARLQQGIIVNDVRNERYFMPNPLLPNTRSELAVPLIAGSRLLGVLDAQADVVGRFSQVDLQIQTTLASQVAVVLRNAGLYAETQAALAETEAIYDISAQISTALTLDEVLQAAIAPAIDSGATSAQLFSCELDSQSRQPDWIEVAATWADGLTAAHIPAGARFYLPDFPFANLWLNDPYNPVLIGHVAEDKRLDSSARAAFLQNGVAASILMPLNLAGHWVGLIAINWKTPCFFTEADRRLYKSVATQAGVVVNNLMLLEEARQRAVQLERLAQVESKLSKAGAEKEILATVAQILESDQQTTIVLYYIDLNLDGQPARLNPIARWRNGTAQLRDATANRPVRLDSLPGARLWLDAPDKTLLFEDVSVDPRLDESAHQKAAELGLKGMAIIPLFSGGRWQGVLTFNWPEPHQFTADEQFMLQQLLEPIAAVVAGRRAYVAQQQTLDETASLYIAGRRISEATDLNGIVVAVAEAGPVSVINRVLLHTFERNELGEIVALEVTANWHSGYGSLPTPAGTRFSLSEFSHLSLFLSSEPLFFDDVQHDERLRPEVVAVMQRSNIKAMAVLPLSVGAQRIGVLLLEGEDAYQFTDREIQPYLALTRQAAIAIENQRLLKQTKLALDEAEAAQRRYTVQAWEAYRTKNKALSYEQVRGDKIFLQAGLTEEISQAIAQIQTQPESSLIPETEPGKIDDEIEIDYRQRRKKSERTKSNLTIPLAVRGEIIGVLGLEENDEREWLPQERALAQAIAEQLAQAAENLRLIDETQQRAARERKVNEIGEKIRAAQSLEEALQIAVKEVGVNLQAPETSAKLEVKQ
jgi:GAF domain-containing protein